MGDLSFKTIQLLEILRKEEEVFGKSGCSLNLEI